MGLVNGFKNFETLQVAVYLQNVEGLSRQADGIAREYVDKVRDDWSCAPDAGFQAGKELREMVEELAGLGRETYCTQTMNGFLDDMINLFMEKVDWSALTNHLVDPILRDSAK